MDKQGQIAFDFFGTSTEEQTSADPSGKLKENTSYQQVPSITPERKLVPPAQVEMIDEPESDSVFIPVLKRENKPNALLTGNGISEKMPETSTQDIIPETALTNPGKSSQPGPRLNSDKDPATNSDPETVPDYDTNSDKEIVPDPETYPDHETDSDSETVPEIDIISPESSDDVIDFNIIKFETEETAVPEQSAAKSTRGRKSIKSYDKDFDLPEIPASESDFTKQYYSIGEVALMFKVNASLLRFWETEFDIIQPRKNKKGDRHFRPVDIKNLELIYDLLRRRKLTIEGAKEYLKSNKRSREKYEMIKSLENLKSFLLEIKANL